MNGVGKAYSNANSALSKNSGVATVMIHATSPVMNLNASFGDKMHKLKGENLKRNKNRYHQKNRRRRRKNEKQRSTKIIVVKRQQTDLRVVVRLVVKLSRNDEFVFWIAPSVIAGVAATGAVVAFIVAFIVAFAGKSRGYFSVPSAFGT